MERKLPIMGWIIPLPSIKKTDQKTQKQTKAPALIIVIPCHNEPDLITTLNSLAECQQPKNPVQVRVVINAAQDAAQDIVEQNQATLKATQNWIAQQQKTNNLEIIIHNEDNLPPKHAGVGLARKIGMDEAAHYYKKSGYKNGPIICLDADCTVEKNYLTSLIEHFKKHPKTPGCSINYAHPLDNLTQQHRLGIAAYELYLRYYRQGLKWAGHPAAYHTVGSSMAVRADIYLAQGGMNRRKAGEDFYFLQKIIALGGFSEIFTTQVNPSPRSSLRVPFGTGRAIDEWLTGDDTIRLTYDPNVFKDLKQFFQQSHRLYQKNIEPNSQALNEYLEEAKFSQAMDKIRDNTTSAQMCEKKFYHWFNPFRALKFIHHASNHHYKKIPIENASQTLWGWLGQAEPKNRDVESWLLSYRKFEVEQANNKQ
ncbi:MAG: glycosyltransferase family 2 protein [Magnetococcales bacterium]|nr:glycosyltransferase family 2 protein [Magnetococcales bacterium]